MCLFMKWKLWPAGLALTVLALFSIQNPACAGVTFERIKTRGDLRCGVSEGIPGFSSKDPSGSWQGLDVDFCRALAAAVLGDSQKVIFYPLQASQRFASLKAGEIDVLARNTTWTLEREATLEVLFAGVLYYDAQAFLVPAASRTNDLSHLEGKSICVVKGTTQEMNLEYIFRDRNLSYQPMVVDTLAKGAEALATGGCAALTSEQPQLAGIRMNAAGGPDTFVQLPEQFAKEPLGPVVRRGDDEWFTIVRWVLFTLVRAEELGITRASLQSRLNNSTDSKMQRWAATDGIISRSLQIQPGWAVRALEAGGNYGELFERNLGSQSPLKLERGLNRLYTQGGLMYAPPFR